MVVAFNILNYNVYVVHMCDDSEHSSVGVVVFRRWWFFVRRCSHVSLLSFSICFHFIARPFPGSSASAPAHRVIVAPFFLSVFCSFVHYMCAVASVVCVRALVVWCVFRVCVCTIKSTRILTLFIYLLEFSLAFFSFSFTIPKIHSTT